MNEQIEKWPDYVPSISETYHVYSFISKNISYALIKTKQRLTFDIRRQAEETRYRGEDDGPFFIFKASNGYEVFSRSRMDIQTERLWLLGAKENERSGSMVFSSDEKRDQAYTQFIKALHEWNSAVNSGLWGHPDLCHKPT